MDFRSAALPQPRQKRHEGGEGQRPPGHQEGLDVPIAAAGLLQSPPRCRREAPAARGAERAARVGPGAGAALAEPGRVTGGTDQRLYAHVRQEGAAAVASKFAASAPSYA